MSATNTLSSGLPDAEHSAQLRKAVIAATVGTTIEWYDFFIYGTAAGLVFPKLFFPNADPLTGTLAAFSTYFIGFVGRPIGAAIFGHFGDRIGRKATLISTLLLMGIATFLVALVPGYDSIGIWGAVILTVLRTLQGIGVGGEWGGSVLISMEWSRTHAAPGSGRLLAAVRRAVRPVPVEPCDPRLQRLVRCRFHRLGLARAVPPQHRPDRHRSVDPDRHPGNPVFKQLVETNLIEKTPIVEVIQKQPREIILSALVRMAEQAPFYIFTAFIFAYGTGTLKMSRELVLSAVLVASVVSFVSIPLFGHISDLIGRRTMYLIGAAVTGVYGFVYFGMLGSGAPALVFLAIVLSLIPHDMMYGPQAALIAEAFTPRLRYSGASLGYQLASIIAGGPAPLIATALIAAYHTGYAVAIYIAACAVISLISAAMMPDYTGKDISAEYDA